MPTADLFEDRDLTLQLHGMLSDIDPVRWRDEMAKALRTRLEDVSARMANRTRLAPLSLALATELPQLTAEVDGKSRWLAFKKRIQPAYARVAESLRAEEIHVPSLRPTNHARSIFHAATALVALALIELVSKSSLIALAAGWAAFAWGCEIARRLSPKVNQKLMALFAPVAHQHETKRVNSATWYATALVILAALAPAAVCAVAVMVLGFGDPTAALVGRRFGRVRLLHGRSLEGSLAFVVSGAAVSVLVLRLFHAGISPLHALVAAVAGAFAGAVAELVSLRVDDNFSIPLSAALGAGLALWLL
jgi:dolichol kinase